MDKLRETKLKKLKASKRPHKVTVDVKELADTVNSLKDYLSELENSRTQETKNIADSLLE